MRLSSIGSGSVAGGEHAAILLSDAEHYAAWWQTSEKRLAAEGGRGPPA